METKVKVLPKGKHQPTFANHGPATTNNVPLNQRGGIRHPERQDIAKRIAQLREAIRSNLVRAGSAAHRGRMERALELSLMAHKQRDLLLTLADKAASLSAQPAMPDNMSNPKPARTKTIVTRKAYKRWADK